MPEYKVYQYETTWGVDYRIAVSDYYARHKSRHIGYMKAPSLVEASRRLKHIIFVAVHEDLEVPQKAGG